MNENNKKNMTVVWILLGMIIGFSIGYLMFRKSIFKSKKIEVLGTLMIPQREEKELNRLDSLTIFVGEPGSGRGCDIYAVEGYIFRGINDGFSGSVNPKIIWGASFKMSARKDCNCVIIPGKIQEGIVTASYEPSQKSMPRPCLINIILF